MLAIGKKSYKPVLTQMHAVLCSLSLMYNGFTIIPAALHLATALCDLDMGKQHSDSKYGTAMYSTAGSGARVAGLHTLQVLPNLRSVRLWINDDDPEVADLQSARPGLTIASTKSRVLLR